MTLSCAQARMMASDLLDQALTEPEGADLLEHIRTCPSCPQLYRAMAAIHQHLHAATPAIPRDELRRQIHRLFTEDA